VHPPPSPGWTDFSIITEFYAIKGRCEFSAFNVLRIGLAADGTKETAGVDQSVDLARLLACSVKLSKNVIYLRS
jgi:hypothetical protein